MEYEVKKQDLLYPGLSFKIVGILYDVYNTLGAGHYEKTYHKGIVLGLVKNNLEYIHEYRVDLKVYGKKIGHCFADFLVDNKVIVEIKKGLQFKKEDVEQTLKYLEARKLKLGILALYAPKEVKIVRVINWKLLNNCNSMQNSNS